MPIIPLEEALSELAELRSRAHAWYSDEIDDEIERLAREEGLSQRAIARRLEPSYSYVAKVFQERGLEPAGYERRGRRYFEYNGKRIEIRGRHSTRKCRAVLEEYEAGGLPSGLSEKYDMPVSTIEKLAARAGVRRSREEAAANRVVAEVGVSPVWRRHQVRRLYLEEEKSITELSERFDVTAACIIDDLRHMGVETRSQSEGLIISHWGSMDAYRAFVRDVGIQVEMKGRPKKRMCEKYDVCFRTVDHALERWHETMEHQYETA